MVLVVPFLRRITRIFIDQKSSAGTRYTANGYHSQEVTHQRRQPKPDNNAYRYAQGIYSGRRGFFFLFSGHDRLL